MPTMAGMPKSKPVHLEIHIGNGVRAAYKARLVVDMTSPKAILHTVKVLRKAADTLEEIARTDLRPGVARRRREVARVVKMAKAHGKRHAKSTANMN